MYIGGHVRFVLWQGRDDSRYHSVNIYTCCSVQCIESRPVTRYTCVVDSLSCFISDELHMVEIFKHNFKSFKFGIKSAYSRGGIYSLYRAIHNITQLSETGWCNVHTRIRVFTKSSFRKRVIRRHILQI